MDHWIVHDKIFSSGGATLYKKPSDQTVYVTSAWDCNENWIKFSFVYKSWLIILEAGGRGGTRGGRGRGGRGRGDSSSRGRWHDFINLYSIIPYKYYI